MKHPKSDLLQGTLDLLILRTLASGDMHGWGISQRLQQIYEQLGVIMAEYRPAEAAIEALFFGKNVTTAIKGTSRSLTQARKARIAPASAMRTASVSHTIALALKTSPACPLGTIRVS